MLTVDDFAQFVADVHSPGGAEQRREPFPWQRALLERIVTDGQWPEVIDVPTGLGKTSLLDIAVFVAACRPDLARRRIFFVVDRRLVVDEAYEHAERLRAALTDPQTPVCQAVAEALTVDGDDGGPLTVTRMRGGVTWDRVWVERPDRVAIVTGTVDQVGSRLLFRGYGVSEYARSIDAALVGTDSLIVVDEAHLATALRTTIESALAQDTWPMAKRPTLVTMSATTGEVADARVHRISADDEGHRVAGPRLRAAKRLRLVEVATTKKRAQTELPRVLADLASAEATGAAVVGVVVNTVARARAVHTLLAGETDTLLLTGRSRPVDRDLLLDEYYHRIRVGRKREGQRPLIVVATQTIEVGANLDLDVLITESAPLPALIQRLGRLNRMGEHQAPCPAYVVHDSSVDAQDPVYGPARLETWQWLATRAPVGTPRDLSRAGEGFDASPAALRTLAAVAPATANSSTQPYVPLLTTATLDAWTRTSPTPYPDPPIPPYLHGLDDRKPPVTLVWRAGLPADPPRRWGTLVDLVPPVATETIELPAHEVRRWLRGEDETDAEPVADIGIPEPVADEADPAAPDGLSDVERVRDGRGRPLVLRYPRREAGEVITAGQIRPGDTIVVPTTYGGCDRFGWHPDSPAPVVDVAELARPPHRPLLRIGPHLRAVAAHVAGTLDGEGDPLKVVLDLATSDESAERADYQGPLTDWAESLPSENRLRKLLDALLDQFGRCTVSAPRDVDATTGAVWTPEYPVLLAVRSWSADDDSESASSSSAYPGKKIALDRHQAAVAARAAQIAKNLKLPERVVASVKAAARWHDEGKRDLRFQTMLFGGRREAAELARTAVAKSGLDPNNRTEARRARIAAGYPGGMRHEALSARIAALRLAESGVPGDELDPDLVLHLIASHHGRNRPLLPPVVDPDPVTLRIPGLPDLDTAETVDWQAPERFARLNAEYGRWGLALLEAVVRLADIWCSVRDEEGEVG